MPDLNAVVCLKVTPKPEEIKVEVDSRRLLRTGVRSEINPPDMNALELALDVRDRYGGTVTVLSMGPPLFEPYIRVALAMGADRAILLSDPAFGGADTLATSYTLAQGIRRIGQVDLVFCGEESSDGATGHVPPGLAEWLDSGLITVVDQLEIDPGGRLIRARREVNGRVELWESPLPAVISVRTAANEPRFMDYRVKEWAFERAKISVWSSTDLDLDEWRIGAPGSPTTVSGLTQAPVRERKRETVAGSLEEIADHIQVVLQNDIKPR